MTKNLCAKLIVSIVSYGNPSDVNHCLQSLARSTCTDFEVFVCENAGHQAFLNLKELLIKRTGVLELDERLDPIDEAGGRLTAVAKCRLRGSGVRVHLAEAVDNLGYAGGVNAWLERLVSNPGWEAVLVLNPDTQVNEICLSELLDKAGEGFGVVGGTLVYDDAPDKIINYGLHWSRITGRTIAVGRNEPAGSSPSPEALADIDAISGACVLVTRGFVEDVGLMTEDYFLYMEDLEWGQRRGHYRIGFAPKAVIRHIGSTAIGLTDSPRDRSRLSIYLVARNRILHARRWAEWLWVIHFAVGIVDSVKYLAHGAPSAAKMSFAGLISGARGVTGKPSPQLFDDVPNEANS
jgi:GT2 family glycosyltransferase